MELANKSVGFAMTGSFCTFADVIPQIQKLVDAGAKVTPILSHSVDALDTRFFAARDLKERLQEITGSNIIASIIEAEPIGPRKLLDVLVVAPCTGNTLAKVNSGITDTAVTMAVKAHLRNEGPVVLHMSTNDGLGNNARNIGRLMAMRNIYFVPFRQDDPQKKPRSIVADAELLVPSVISALDGVQLQPMMLGPGQ